MEVGRGKLEDGRWEMEVGRWKKEARDLTRNLIFLIS
jgi:hypothetical protein